MPSRRPAKAAHVGGSQTTLTQFVRVMPSRGLGGRSDFNTHLTPTPGSSRASPIDLRSPSPPNSGSEPDDPIPHARHSERQWVDGISDDPESNGASTWRNLRPSAKNSSRTREASGCTYLGDPCVPLPTTLTPIFRSGTSKESGRTELPPDPIVAREYNDDPLITKRPFPPFLDNDLACARGCTHSGDLNDVVDSSQTQILFFHEDLYPIQNKSVGNNNIYNCRPVLASLHAPERRPVNLSAPENQPRTPTPHSSIIPSSQTPDPLHLWGSMDVVPYVADLAPADCPTRISHPSNHYDAAADPMLALPHNPSTTISGVVDTIMDSPWPRDMHSSCADLRVLESQELSHNYPNDHLATPTYDVPEVLPSGTAENPIHSAEAVSSLRAQNAEYRLASQSLYEELPHKAYNVPSGHDDSTITAPEAPSGTCSDVIIPATTRQRPEPRSRETSYKSSYSVEVTGTPSHIKRMLSGSYDASLQRYINWEASGPNTRE